MSAFHKLQDHRRAYNSHDIRLSEVVAVSMPISQSGGDWYCNVALRDGTCYQIGGDMNSTYSFRDELMHALEQDAKSAPVAPVNDPRCSAVLKAQGKAYPRTCPVHGLGPCPPIRTEDATGD